MVQGQERVFPPFFLVLLDGLAGLFHSHSNQWRFYDWIVFNRAVRHAMRKSVFLQPHGIRAVRLALFGLYCRYSVKGGDGYG